MSRSGYSDDYDQWSLIRWRGAVNSAIKGKRGQAMLRELLTALDAMPDKRLIAEELQTADGEYCALGVLGKRRGIDMSNIDPDDSLTVAQAFGIAEAMASEIMWMNDEVAADEWEWIEVEFCGPMRRGYLDFDSHKRTVRIRNERIEEQRWMAMRKWVAENIKDGK